mgnify:CR=1 FL=1
MENGIDCVFIDKCDIEVERTPDKDVYKVRFYLDLEGQRKEIEIILDFRSRNIPWGIKKCLEHRL